MSKQNQQTRQSTGNGQDASLAVNTVSPVGAWRLTLAPVQGTPVPALINIHADGTLTTATLPVEPFLGAADRVIFVSPGHGLWKTIALNTVRVKIVGIAATDRGAHAASATIQGRVGLDEDGHTLNGSYEAVVYDSTGNALATEQGMLQATRIALEDESLPAR